MRQPKSVILLLLLTFAACKHPGPAVYTGSKIDTVLNCHNHSTTTYTYDDNGNIAEIDVPYGNKTLFTTTNDSVIENIYSAANVFLGGYVYFIHNGVADSARGFGQFVNQTFNYSYDANYMLTGINSYLSRSLDSTIVYSNGNKNIISIEREAAASGAHTFDYFTYNLSSGNTLGNQAIGENYLGTQTNNLTNTDVKINDNGDTSDIILYRYRYDTTGRPDTVSTYSFRAHPGMQIDSFVYTYY